MPCIYCAEALNIDTDEYVVLLAGTTQVLAYATTDALHLPTGFINRPKEYAHLDCFLAFVEQRGHPIGKSGEQRINSVRQFLN